VPKDFYPDLVRLLHAAGWVKVAGGKGSHEKWRNPATGKVSQCRVQKAATQQTKY
jgi:HicA toxin of bacterial toxin-antitoxin,